MNGAEREDAIRERIDDVVAEMESIWGEAGFRGSQEGYEWLQMHYGISEEEDVQWQLIYEESLNELSSEDEHDEDLMQILRNREAVLAFLEHHLAKYRSSNAVYEMLGDMQIEDEEITPLSSYMRRIALDLGLDPDAATRRDVYHARRRQIALDAGLDPATATPQEILHADMAMRWGVAPTASTEEVNEAARRILAGKAGLDETADWDTINTARSRQKLERSAAPLRQTAEKLGLDHATASRESVEQERLQRRAIKASLALNATRGEIKQAEDQQKRERQLRRDAKRKARVHLTEACPALQSQDTNDQDALSSLATAD